MRSKKYMRRIPVGGALGRVTAINNKTRGIWVRLDKEGELIHMPGSLSVNKIGQRVRISARPI